MCQALRYQAVPNVRSAGGSRNLADSAAALPGAIGLGHVEVVTKPTCVTLGPTAGKPVRVSPHATTRKCILVWGYQWLL